MIIRIGGWILFVTACAAATATRILLFFIFSCSSMTKNMFNGKILLGSWFHDEILSTTESSASSCTFFFFLPSETGAHGHQRQEEENLSLFDRVVGTFCCSAVVMTNSHIERFSAAGSVGARAKCGLRWDNNTKKPVGRRAFLIHEQTLPSFSYATYSTHRENMCNQAGTGWQTFMCWWAQRKKNRVWERTGEIYDYQLAPMTTTTYISMTHLFTE